MKYARLRCSRFTHRMGAWHIVPGETAICGARIRNTTQYWERSGEAAEGYEYMDSAVEMQGVCFNCKQIEEARK